MPESRKFQNPPLPIPDPLRGEEEGSFAEYTLTTRLPGIARRVLEENAFPPEVASGIEKLVASMPQESIQAIQDPEAPDADEWEAWMLPYLDQSWMQAPWFVAETYFFRRILAATGYFRPGPGHGVDPYRQQKLQGLEAHHLGTRTLAVQLATWGAEPVERPGEVERLTQLLEMNVWGNQADLSMWPIGTEEGPGLSRARESTHLLANQAEQAAGYLLGLSTPARVDFILDNTGLELVYDLGLADYLLRQGIASSIRFHAKFYPTYVSDATAADIYTTLDFFTRSREDEVQALGKRLQEHLRSGRLLLADHLFWISPLSFWELPSRLYAELAGADLLISKGDANYRRLLGDRHWPLSTPFAQILRYSPAPLLALRVLKADMGAGLPADRLEELDRQDPKWMVNGQWGVIQFAPGG